MVARTLHPFPAKMAPDIAMAHLDSVGAAPVSVLDPMCGSGTVLSAAVARGHIAYGFDVDPLAVLMSTVATTHVDTEHVRSEAARVLRAAAGAGPDDPPWTDAETIRFAAYWFGPQQREDLAKLSNAIKATDDVDVMRCLQIALSRIIVTKSPRASLASDTSHSRPHRTQTTSDYDVNKGFESSVSALCRLLEARQIRGASHVQLGDVRTLTLGDNSIDLAITSPPYLNAIDYLRGHKLSLIWLGYSIPELRRIRSNSIGAERALEHAPSRTVSEMVDEIRGAALDPDKLPISTITRYAHDLSRFSNELYRVIKPGGRIVTVIGNSTLRGNFIQNDRLMQRAYEMAGFRFVERTERDLPENRRYLPTRSDSALTKRMRKEVILTVERAQ